MMRRESADGRAREVAGIPGRPRSPSTSNRVDEMSRSRCEIDRVRGWEVGWNAPILDPDESGTSVP